MNSNKNGDNQSKYGTFISPQKQTQTLQETIMKDGSERTNSSNNYSFAYFKYIQIIIFLITIIGGCYFVLIIFSFAQPRNNKYCFDSNIKKFRLCNWEDTCIKGRNIEIFNNEIYDEDPTEELKQINRKYHSFFLMSSLNFLLGNKNYEKNYKLANFFFVRIIWTKRENYWFNNYFMIKCGSDSKSYSYIIVMTFGLIFGNIFFGLLSDISGRKTGILITLFLQFLLGFLFVTISHYIKKNKSITGDIDISIYPEIEEFITNVNTPLFQGLNITDLYANYIRLFPDHAKFSVNKQIWNTQFSTYLIFFYYLIFFWMFTSGPTYSICLAYSLEYSIGEEHAHNNLKYIHCCPFISYIISFAIITRFDNLQLSIVIISICSLLLFLLFYFLTYESLRYYYEYSRFDLITNVTRNLLDNHSNFFGNRVNNNLLVDWSSKDKTEYNTMIKNRSASYWKTMFLSINYEDKALVKNSFFQSFANIISHGKKTNFKIQKFYRSPFSIYLLIKKNKKYRNNILITFTFWLIVSVIYEFIFDRLFLSIVFNRSNLHNNFVINQYCVWTAVVQILAVFVISYFQKLTSSSTMLFIILLLLLFFSIIYEIILGWTNYNNVDLQQFTYFSLESIYDNSGIFLQVVLFIMFFLNSGLQIISWIYVIKLSMTVYRCTLFGIFNIFTALAILYSYGMNLEFERLFLYICMFCIVGGGMIVFIVNDGEGPLIVDMHEIRSDNNNLNYKITDKR